jgi:hypothetical protein
MFVVIQHQVNDPKRFWQAPESFIQRLPANLKLHSTYGNADGTRAVCLWECDSLQNLQTFIDNESRGMSQNEYFEVDEQKAVGLPSSKRAA